MIRLENVVKEYSPGTTALNGVSLRIEPGEFVFVVGESGSGKSTFIRLLLKEIEPTSGSIFINGKNLGDVDKKGMASYRRNLGVVFQDFRLLRDRTVYENVAFAQRAVMARPRQIRKRVPMVLSMVGLASKYRAYPDELSGGEQQRVAIARALVNRPKILMADEPTGNLDSGNAWEIIRLLNEINKNGTTVLVVTHNLDIVKAMKKRVIRLDKGRVISGITPEAARYEF